MTINGTLVTSLLLFCHYGTITLRYHSSTLSALSRCFSIAGEAVTEVNVTHFSRFIE